MSWLNPLSWWASPQPEQVQQKAAEQNQTGSYLSWLNPLNWVYGQTAGVEEPKKENEPQINPETNRNIEIPVPDNVPEIAKENVLEKLPATQSPNLLNVVRKPQGPTNRKVPSRGHIVAIRDKYVDAKPIQEEESSREITFDSPVEEEKKVEPAAPIRFSPMKAGAFGIGNIDAGALRAGLRKVSAN